MASVPPVIRPVSTEEFPEYYRVLADAFGEDVHDSDRDNDLGVFEPERSLAVFDGDQIVATAGAFSRRLTLPGRVEPVAAVTMVGVAPTYRRRGLLTAMMRRQLTDLFEGGREAIAVLWASEGAIYGRFGYGPAACQATLTGQTPRMRLRPDTGAATIRQVDVAELPLLVGGLWDRLGARTVGWLDRPARWWRFTLYDPPHQRNGASALRAVVCEDATGEVAGYAVYRIRPDRQATGHEHEVRVHELVAATPAAQAATWSFLVKLDLVRRIHAERRPVDEPLRHLLADIRAARLTVTDSLWVRTVDLGRALAARCYAAEVDVVLDVTDEVCPWNSGRWRLSAGPDGARCARTTHPADLSLTSTELGSALLGGMSMAALAAAGRVDEHRAGTLAQVSRAFAADRAPWCPDTF